MDPHPIKHIKTLFALFLLSLTSPLAAQDIDFDKESSLGKLFIRMYGEIHYVQPVGGDTYGQGQFDAKRIVTLFGYQFDKNTQFVTELELEHANEMFLEQAFIKHKLKGHMTLKAGMLLIPMGWVNENHEPNNYFSVDRPLIDRLIVPSTWRDIGVGITGLLPSLDLRYQAYLVNGLGGYKNGAPNLGGSTAYRSGRQKGNKTIMSGLPSFSGQLEYYGFSNSKIGLSAYAGRSNSDAYNGLDRNDQLAMATADSTTVLTTMIGLHSITQLENWTVMSQFLYSRNSGHTAYNKMTGANVSEALMGAHLEVGRKFGNDKWLGFFRYSFYDTALGNEENVPKYFGLNHVLDAGINFFPANGTVFKLALEMSQVHNQPVYSINSGIGVWF